VANEEDPEVKLFLLGSFLERMRQTIFRQTMFAEYELEIHRRAEAGESLTGESLSELYLQILRDYHGHDQGVMEIDELYAVEWAYIPHFYRNFYVYQYATGMIAAIALAEQVMAGEPGALERYLDFLSAGGSDYPMTILAKAGADLSTDTPVTIAMRSFERTLDQIEELLEGQEPRPTN
jgi:oligoendopeptidase F